MNRKTKDLLYQLSAILILLAAILYYFMPEIARYVMVLGVAGFGAFTFTSPYPGKSLRGKRLFNIQIFAVVLMVISAYLMFIMMNEWVIPLLISGLLILYCSLLLPKELQKENKENDK